MKRLKFLYAMALMLLTMACTRQEVMEEVNIPSGGYIYFNTEVASRGTLITELKGESFGVNAYIYDDEVDWNTVKVQATPELFYQKEIKWDVNGYYTYDDKKTWSADSLYTFFGYYPYGNSSLTMSSDTYEGDPYLEYLLPTGDDVTQMVDVMTASVYDTDNSQSNYVGLTFKHRLVAMDVQARNFNDPENGEEVHIKITSLKMKFNNMKHNGAKLMLDASLKKDSLYVADTTAWKPNYALVGNPITISPTDTSTGEAQPVALTGTTYNPKTTLIFLPQEGEVKDDETEYLNGWIEFTYTFVDKDGNNMNVTVDGTAVSTVTKTMPFTTGKNMVAGRKYYFQMTFSRTTITIAVIESGEWTDKDVDIEFD